MTIVSAKFLVKTNGHDIVDITLRVKKIILQNKVQDALICVHSPFSSASVGVMEYDPDMVKKFFEFTDKFLPQKTGDKNPSYLKGLFTGNSATIPFIRGEFELDRFQRILLFDFDVKKRTRSVIIQIIY